MTGPSLNWSNLYVIFRREVRDQVRDRRTLFMIFVLPILLYPMLGIGVLKFGTALAQKQQVVVVVGAEFLAQAPPLLNSRGDGFNPALFDSPVEAEKLVVRAEPASGPWSDPRRAEQAIRGDEVSAVMTIPRDLQDQLRRETEIDIPIKYKSIDETSPYHRLKEVLSRWRTSIVAGRLKRDKKTESYSEPIQVKAVDVATARELGSNVWSRLFPFLLVMMSLTGAFYPAIDLCAGEKERGTMETLLISPASRTELVLGKFLTVMLASVTMALLNLVSMGLTGIQLAYNLGSFSADPGRRRRHRAADPASGVLDGVAADPPFGFFQRRLPGAGDSGPEHEGGSVLHDAALPRVPAARLPDPGARRETRSVLQPGPDHGGCPAFAGFDPGRLRPGDAVLSAGAVADIDLRRGRAPVGDRSVSARGGLVPRGRTIQSVVVVSPRGP